MTTERLEELAAKCAVAIDGVGRNASYGLSDSDLADLARCARAWAKVGKYQASVTWQNGGWHCSVGWFEHVIADNPIEAVEAAEVGK